MRGFTPLVRGVDKLFLWGVLFFEQIMGETWVIIY